MLQSLPFEVQHLNTAKQTTLMSFFKPTKRSEPQPSTSSGTTKSQPLPSTGLFNEQGKGNSKNMEEGEGE
jgi:hypothetical protein